MDGSVILPGPKLMPVVQIVQDMLHMRSRICALFINHASQCYITRDFSNRNARGFGFKGAQACELCLDIKYPRRLGRHLHRKTWKRPLDFPECFAVAACIQCVLPCVIADVKVQRMDRVVREHVEEEPNLLLRPVTFVL